MDKGKYLGRFINEWRQRTVAIYEHPTNAFKVITVGRPFDGGKAIECEEYRKDCTVLLQHIEDAAAQGRVHRYE